MLIDALNTNNFIQFNIALAQCDAIGLHGAIYISELSNIYRKAFEKKRLDNDFFLVDRKYIAKRTTISIEEQINLDINLMKLNLLKKDLTNPDIIKVDFQLLLCLITHLDTELNEDIRVLCNIPKSSKKRGTKSVTSDPSLPKKTKKEKIIENLQNSLVESDPELLKALKGWIETIGTVNFMTKVQLDTFLTDLYNYIGNNKALGVRLVNIAISQGYKTFEFVKSIYEKSERYKAQVTSSGPRITAQNVISDTEIKQSKQF